jgi:hypothetical protein
MLKVKCFFCGNKAGRKDCFTINMDTLEGKHKVNVCPKCANEFDDIMKELEIVIEERNNTI